MTHRRLSSMIGAIGSLLIFTACAHADFKALDARLTGRDAVLLMSDQGIVYQKNMDKPLVPASTLKVLTALAAFHYLGEGFRFKTEFYLDAQNNLTIKGYGDPLLVSESIDVCCDMLSTKLKEKTRELNHILIDDSYFSDITIPGATAHSSQPYDAVNGALCANFNTVFFKRDAHGNPVSAEKQTPLLPYVLDRISSSGLTQGRILLNRSESRVYAGYLFKYFLEKKGLVVKGDVRDAQAPSPEDLIYEYASPYSLSEVISKLLEFSNNFIANQLCLTMGSNRLGAPATLDKGVSILNQYLATEIKLPHVTVVEGSGLSRKNRITAKDMDQLLQRFEPHRRLMKQTGNIFYKTGTLKGISTRVGYIEKPDGSLYRFVVFCNSPNLYSEPITRFLADRIKK